MLSFLKTEYLTNLKDKNVQLAKQKRSFCLAVLALYHLDSQEKSGIIDFSLVDIDFMNDL